MQHRTRRVESAAEKAHRAEFTKHGERSKDRSSQRTQHGERITENAETRAKRISRGYPYGEPPETIPTESPAKRAQRTERSVESTARITQRGEPSAESPARRARREEPSAENTTHRM